MSVHDMRFNQFKCSASLPRYSYSTFCIVLVHIRAIRNHWIVGFFISNIRAMAPKVPPISPEHFPGGSEVQADRDQTYVLVVRALPHGACLIGRHRRESTSKRLQGPCLRWSRTTRNGPFELQGGQFSSHLCMMC